MPEVPQRYEGTIAVFKLQQGIGEGGRKALLKVDLQNRKRLLIAHGIHIIQQLGGINGIIYYPGTLLSRTGLIKCSDSSVSEIISTGRLRMLLVCISLVAAWFVKGRRDDSRCRLALITPREMRSFLRRPSKPVSPGRWRPIPVTESALSSSSI